MYKRQGQRIRLSYTVRLEHDRYAWPAGMEEVSYRTDEGVMATGAALFFADGDAPVQAPIEVDFDLPRGWQARTPWTGTGNGDRFRVDSRRELISNALFLGICLLYTSSEPMFSDFKSHGFDLEAPQLRAPDRLDRLLVIMALAMHGCVRVGQEEAREGVSSRNGNESTLSLTGSS